MRGRGVVAVHSHTAESEVRRRWVRHVASAIGVLATCAAIAACGSSSSSGTGSSSSGSSTAASSSGSATSAASPGVTTAKAFLAKYATAPTTLGNVPALPKPAPKGKMIVFLQCEEQQCAEVGKGFAAATKAVGWSYKSIGFNSAEPSTLTSALQTALQYHPVAVEFQGSPYSQWSSEVPAYKAAGVKLIPITLGTVPTNATIPIEIGSPSLFDLYGKLIADWFIVDSNGKGKAVFANVPEYPTFAITGEAFSKEVAANCPACSVKTVNLTIAELDNNQVDPTVVSALRDDPSATYAIAPDGALYTGLPEQLKAASLDNITVGGGAATEENEQDLLNGSESAWVVQSFEEQGWIGTDIALRVAEGTSLPAADSLQPTEVLTKGNVGQAEADYAVPSNFESLFEQLWSK
jgi:ribose transport system substrate-binding protein